MSGDPCRPQAQDDRCDRRSVRPVHPAGHSRSHPVRQRTGVPRQAGAGMDRSCRYQDRLQREGPPLGERLHRESQPRPSRCAAQRRDFLHFTRGPDRHRELATPLQHDQAARLNRIQATSTRGVRARIRCVAGCAPPTGSAGHAGATANLKLTFHLDHSAGADQVCPHAALLRDVIQMSLVDTWAATGAGAFTLTENGLYTIEAWQRFLGRLNPDGLFTVSRWYARGEVDETGRMVSLAVATLLANGVAEPRRHLFLAAAGNVATLIVTKSPLSAAALAALKDAAKANEFPVLLSTREDRQRHGPQYARPDHR